MGTTNISLHSLLATDEALTSPAVLEASFPLISSDEEPRSGSTEHPAVGVSIMLKNDETNVAPVSETLAAENMQPTSSHQVCTYLVVGNIGPFGLRIRPNLGDKDNGRMTESAYDTKIFSGLLT